MRFVILLALAITSPSYVMAQPCPKQPPDSIQLLDRTMVVMVLNRTTGLWGASEVALGQRNTVNFNQNPLCFFYGVRPGRYTVGALVIRVIRKFSRGIEPERVFLHRGEGFFSDEGHAKDEWNGVKTLKFYEDFHERDRRDRGFLTDFHGYWTQDKSSNTVEPQGRKRAFVYGSKTPSAVLRRTYLLHYSSSTGSWIPFNVETAGEPDKLEEVEFTVWDLGLQSRMPVLKGSVSR